VQILRGCNVSYVVRMTQGGVVGSFPATLINYRSRESSAQSRTLLEHCALTESGILSQLLWESGRKSWPNASVGLVEV
jgi:hypothetical protein